MHKFAGLIFWIFFTVASAEISQKNVEDFITQISKNNPNFTEASIASNIKAKMLSEGCSDSESSDKVKQLNFVKDKVNNIIKNMDFIQEQCLTHNLSGFGVTIASDQSAYSALAALSEDNVKRIKGLNLYKGSLPFEIEDLIYSIEYQPGHFSQSGHSGMTLPLLSSRTLKEIGVIPYGHNSSRKFNRELIQSDDNVFFFPMSYNLKGSTRYGSIATFLDKDFARQKAWISPTTMDPVHLIAWIDETPADFDIESEEAGKILIQAKLRLKNYIFDYEGFVKVTRHLMLVHFERLIRENRSEFDQQIEKLRTRTDVHQVMKEVWAYMGVPERSGFELKVPVMIPVNMLF